MAASYSARNALVQVLYVDEVREGGLWFSADS